MTPYTQGTTAHRYLGHGQCIEVKVQSITDDGRVILEDGSMINRFTKSFYHHTDDCPVPRLRVIQGTGSTVTINFPTVEEERIYQSSKPDKRGPYTTQRMSNNTFRCNCPGNTYHPPCSHIKDWQSELALATD